MSINLEDLLQRDRRRFPQAIFDYVGGRCRDEYTVHTNRRDFERYILVYTLGERLCTPIPASNRACPQ